MLPGQHSLDNDSERQQAEHQDITQTYVERSLQISAVLFVTTHEHPQNVSVLLKCIVAIYDSIAKFFIQEKRSTQNQIAKR